MYQAIRVAFAMEPWTFRSESNKHGSTKKRIDFPPPVGSDTKMSFPAIMLCSASRCSFLSVTLNFCLSGLKDSRSNLSPTRRRHDRNAHNTHNNYAN